MKHSVIFLAAALLAAPCLAQQQHMETSISGSLNGNNPVTSADQRALENTLRLKAAKGKTPEQLQAEDLANATAAAADIHLSCVVKNAKLAGEKIDKTNKGSVKTSTYEVVCGNGLGYLLEKRDPGETTAMTCFSVAATADADLKAKRPVGLTCALPENADAKAMATGALAKLGKYCKTRDTRWIGINPKSHTDYLEIACAGDVGYIMASPLPGSATPLVAVTCRDAAMQGIPCKLTAVQVLTLQTFKDALAQHHVDCTVTDARSVGREQLSQRHVVEFACKDHPEGLVAYIPLGDNKAPFETSTCAAAAKHGVACKLTGK
jgi:hypothetical protein